MLFVAQLLGQPVEGKTGETLGKLADLIVRIGDEAYPPITGLVVRDQRRRFYVPASHLSGLDGLIRLKSSVIDLQPFRRRNNEVLISKDVLDHQIIDITGRRIVRVNDIQIAPLDSTYRVVGVDVSPQALVRRLAPRRLSSQIVGRTVIAWPDVQYLASAAPVQLKVSYEGLAKLNPVDLARIVDALSYPESAEIVAALDDETAAETLEEVSDTRVADLLEGMDHERAADILEEMEPSSAADALEDLDGEVAEALLSRMEPEEAADVQERLKYDEDSVGRLMTPDIVRVGVNSTVGDALDQLRAMEIEEVPDPLLGVHVVADDDPDHLIGVLRLRNLILSPPDTPVTAVMQDGMPTVEPTDEAETVARILAEYNLLAVPVIEDGRLVGSVTVDDAMAVMLPEIWQRRGTRTFG